MVRGLGGIYLIELFVPVLAPAANGTAGEVSAWCSGMDLAAGDAVPAGSFADFATTRLQRLQAPDVAVDEEKTGTVCHGDDRH